LVFRSRRGITNLSPAPEKEAIRVHPIGNRASNDGKQVEDHRWVTGILEEQLAQDIQDNSEDNECDESGGGDNSNASLGDLLIERISDNFENSHVRDEVECEG
jgi:hypothetical protein